MAILELVQHQTVPYALSKIVCHLYPIDFETINSLSFEPAGGTAAKEVRGA
jgi:hypothetical protein